MNEEPANRIVAFHQGADARRALEEHGIPGALLLDVLPYALVPLSDREAAALRTHPGVKAIDANPPVALHLDTAINATRVREVQDGGVFTGAPSPHGRGPGGRGPPGWEDRMHPGAEPTGLRGDGVGIAIVDTGVDCEHPDIGPRCVPHRNLVCTAPAAVVLQDPRFGINHTLGVGPPAAGCRESPGPNSDQGPDAGHGTHVAGLAVGDGFASEGRFRGVAPGASLYVYAFDASGGLFAALLAFDHILAHPSEGGLAPIRIVSNSWRVGPDFAYLLEDAVRALVSAGLVVVFAIGNSGDREDDTEVEALLSDDPNAACRFRDDQGAPLPGLLCVGNYNDGEAGTREGDLSASSSRGFTDQSETWPDIVAPGQLITSTRFIRCPAGRMLGLPAEGTVPGTQTSFGACYTKMSGTSMATPHVAGVAALMLQASPQLAPGDVEAILQETAYPFEARAPYPNRHAGFGLVDALAAVQAAVDGQ